MLVPTLIPADHHTYLYDLEFHPELQIQAKNQWTPSTKTPGDCIASWITGPTYGSPNLASTSTSVPIQTVTSASASQRPPAESNQLSTNFWRPTEIILRLREVYYWIQKSDLFLAELRLLLTCHSTSTQSAAKTEHQPPFSWFTTCQVGITSYMYLNNHSTKARANSHTKKCYQETKSDTLVPL